MSALGVEDGTAVVIYDRNGTTWATRLWWLLRAYGFDAAAVLDGGWPPGRTRSRTLPAPAHDGRSSRPVRSRGGSPTAPRSRTGRPACSTRSRPTSSAAARIRRRAPNLAVAATCSTRTPAGFARADELRERLGAVGALGGGRVVTYCGGGISATLDAFALTLLGEPDVAVYDGSMGEWMADPALADRARLGQHARHFGHETCLQVVPGMVPVHRRRTAITPLIGLTRGQTPSQSDPVLRIASRPHRNTGGGDMSRRAGLLLAVVLMAGGALGCRARLRRTRVLRAVLRTASTSTSSRDRPVRPRSATRSTYTGRVADTTPASARVRRHQRRRSSCSSRPRRDAQRPDVRPSPSGSTCRALPGGSCKSAAYRLPVNVEPRGRRRDRVRATRHAASCTTLRPTTRPTSPRRSGTTVIVKPGDHDRQDRLDRGPAPAPQNVTYTFTVTNDQRRTPVPTGQRDRRPTASARHAAGPDCGRRRQRRQQARSDARRGSTRAR